jgi:nucleoid-associated protein YgaU
MALRSHDLVSPVEEAVVYKFPAPGRLKHAATRMLAPVLVAVVLALLLWSSTRPQRFTGGSRPGAPAVVVVDEGQTLWELSQRYAPLGVDWRAYADAVVDLNDFDGPLQVGQRLRLPR